MKYALAYIFAFCLLAPLASAQEFSWVKYFQGQHHQSPISMQVDGAGNQYASFSYQTEITFDSITLQGNNAGRGLILKQDSAGNVVWYKIARPASTAYAVIPLSTVFSSNGNLIFFLTCRTHVIIDSDTLLHPNNGQGLITFFAEFDTSGNLLDSKILIEASITAANGVANKFYCDANDNLYISLACSDTVTVHDTTGSYVIGVGEGETRVFKFSASGRKFEWMRSFDQHLNFIDLAVDINGNVYLSGVWRFTDSIYFNGSYVIRPQNITGAVFILDKDGHDKNWFAVKSSGNQSAVHHIAAYDNNSVFVSGAFLGDSALFGNTWKKTSGNLAYRFIARYENNGNLIWVKHEDTSYINTVYAFYTGGSIVNYFDQYVYLSYNTHTSNHFPIIIDGQYYHSDNSQVYSYGMNIKLDFLGNVLWGFRTYSPFLAMGTDDFSNFYFTGSWNIDTMKLGNFSAPITNDWQSDGFVGKTFDYAIFRGEVSSGPYCAGDSLYVPYTIHGNYGDSNYFVAEISDEFGNFTGGERELGRIQSKDSGTVAGILPLFQVASSNKYRIRIRSTIPQVQSFYRVDTLQLLIYSRDKADPGDADTICRGDTFMLNTYGGTKWEWSPAHKMSDSTLRQPLVWPDSSFTYFIVISDSSGCGEADTAFKQIIVRPDPKIEADFADTLVCNKSPVVLKVNLSKGDSTGYYVRWYKLGGSSPVLLRNSTQTGSFDALSVSAPSGDTAGTVYMAVLNDSCSRNEDTAYFKIRTYLPLEIVLPFTDTILCNNSALHIAPVLSGGRNSTYTLTWFNSATNQQTDSLAFQSNMQYQTTLKAVFSDNCMADNDSAEAQINLYDPLQLQMGTSSSAFNDTLLCPGESLQLINRNGPGNNAGLVYRWMVGDSLMSVNSGFYFYADSILRSFAYGNGPSLQWARLKYSDVCSELSDSVLIRLPGRPKVNTDSINVSVVDSDAVQINFNEIYADRISRYEILRINGSTTVVVDSAMPVSPGFTHTFTDSVYTLNDRFCYVILSIDSCFNIAVSDTFCPAQLKGYPGNLDNNLYWQPFAGYKIDLYYILQFNGFGWDTIGTVNGSDTSFVHQNLTCNIPHLYKIAALEEGGNRISYSDPLTLTPFDTIKPAAALLKSASVQPDQTVRLEWYPSISSDVKFYEIWRDEGNGFNLLTTVTYDTIFTDTANGHHQSYSYYIVAIDSCNPANRSAPSDTDKTMQVTVSTGACVPLVNVAWDAYEFLPQHVDSYYIWRNENNGSFKKVFSMGSHTIFTDSSVVDSTVYCYRIEAYDATSGISAFSDTICIQPWVFPEPDMAKMLVASVHKTGTTDGEILLEWMKWDMADTFARGYYIRYNNGSGFQLLYNEIDLNITSFVHRDINTKDGSNSYLISTYNLCHEDNDTAKLHRQSENSDVHKVVNLTIKNENGKSTLAWTPYEGFEVEKYEIWRSEDSAPYRMYDMVTANDTSFIDTAIRCGQQYNYEIRTKKLNGMEVSYSDTAAIIGFDTIPPTSVDMFFATVTATDPVAGSIELEFTPATEINREGYIVFRKENSGNWRVVDTIKSSQTTTISYTDSNINTTDKTYGYYVASYDSCGNISLPADTHIVVHLNVYPQSRANILNWSSYHGFVNFSYTIERRTGATSWVPLVSLNDTFYNDSTVRCDTLYTYRILTQSADGDFSHSNLDTATGLELEPPIAPVVHRATVTETGTTTGEILVEWNFSASPDVEYYNVYRSNDGLNWALIAGNVTTNSYSDQNLNTSYEGYFYRIEAIDSCANVSGSHSAPHGTIILNADAGNELVSLSWNHYSGWNVSYYRIWRNGALLDSVPGHHQEYINAPLSCTNYYNFTVEAVADSSLHIISRSNTDSAKPWDFNPPEAPDLIYATIAVPNSEVEVAWNRSLAHDVTGYEVYRQIGNRSKLIKTITNPEDTIFSFYEPDKEEPLCYVVRAIDECGNESEESNRGCIIFPKVEAGNQLNILNWPNYSDWPSGIAAYEIYRSPDTAGWISLGTVPVGTNEFIDDDLDPETNIFVYRVIAIENPGGYDARSASMAVTAIQAPVIWVPNSFSPERSFDLNDTFGPYGAWIKTYDMRIFNRWGELIYETGNGKPWDGRYQGQPVPGGVYLYIIKTYGFNDESELLNGSVTILK